MVQWTQTVTVTPETSGPPPVPGENPNQPFFGRWYGNSSYLSQTGVGNTSMTHARNSFFFWGETSGMFDAVMMEFRYDSTSVYSSGNFGLYDVLFVDAHPTTKLPLLPLQILSRRANFRPKDFLGIANNAAGSSSREFSMTELLQPAEPKKPYCFVMANKGDGHISNNHDLGVTYASTSGPNYALPEEFHSPARIHLPNGTVRAWHPFPHASRNGTNVTYGRVGPSMQQYRCGGKWIGPGNWSSGSSDLHSITISGSNHTRERFMVTRGNRVVDRLYLTPFREQITPSGNTIVTLEQGPSSDTSGNGTVIREWSTATSNIYRKIKNDGQLRLTRRESSNGADDIDKLTPLEITINPPVTLVDGQIYNIRVRTTGSRIIIRARNTAESMNLSPTASNWANHISQRKVAWCAGDDSRGCQTSGNSGSSWSWHNQRRRFGWLFRCVI